MVEQVEIENFKSIRKLKMIDWFRDFKVSEDASTNQRRIQLEDRYIA